MIFDAADFDDHEQLVFFRDADCGLKAIIAIHSTALGPAAGGCRIYPYADEQDAVRDALRLSKGMTLKNAMAGLPLGGGKAVIFADPATQKTPALMQAMGRAVETLGGRYITGEDVGTAPEDMVEIRKETRHVLGLPVSAGGSGDPSPSTALGVLEGMKAAAKHRLDKDTLDGLTVALQGLGHVGFRLAGLLAEEGAKLIVTDTREATIEHAVSDFGATAVSPEAIYDAEADIFAPCAMGAVLNADTIPRLKVSIVAGAANNQLATAADGAVLREKGILYAPDYVINAGGIIQLSAERTGETRKAVTARLRAIGGTLAAVFQAADMQDLPTGEAADRIAEQRIVAGKAAA
jgi:leucine dehydrogenase